MVADVGHSYCGWVTILGIYLLWRDDGGVRLVIIQKHIWCCFADEATVYGEAEVLRWAVLVLRHMATCYHVLTTFLHDWFNRIKNIMLNV